MYSPNHAQSTLRRLGFVSSWRQVIYSSFLLAFTTVSHLTKIMPRRQCDCSRFDFEGFWLQKLHWLFSSRMNPSGFLIIGELILMRTHAARITFSRWKEIPLYKSADPFITSNLWIIIESDRPIAKADSIWYSGVTGKIIWAQEPRIRDGTVPGTKFEP